jgi:hypothetical protein
MLHLKWVVFFYLHPSQHKHLPDEKGGGMVVKYRCHNKGRKETWLGLRKRKSQT